MLLLISTKRCKKGLLLKPLFLASYIWAAFSVCSQEPGPFAVWRAYLVEAGVIFIGILKGFMGLSTKVYSVGRGQPRMSGLSPSTAPDCRDGVVLRALPSRLVVAVGLLLTTTSSALCADSPVDVFSESSEIVLDDDAIARSLGAKRPDQLALEDSGRIRSRSVRGAPLDVVDVSGSSSGALRLSRAPSFTSKIGDRHASITPRNNVVFYTLDPDLQEFVSRTVAQANAEHIAVVALNPKTGAILAIAVSYSPIWP